MHIHYTKGLSIKKVRNRRCPLRIFWTRTDFSKKKFFPILCGTLLWTTPNLLLDVVFFRNLTLMLRWFSALLCRCTYTLLINLIDGFFEMGDLSQIKRIFRRLLKFSSPSVFIMDLVKLGYFKYRWIIFVIDVIHRSARFGSKVLQRFIGLHNACNHAAWKQLHSKGADSPGRRSCGGHQQTLQSFKKARDLKRIIVEKAVNRRKVQGFLAKPLLASSGLPPRSYSYLQLHLFLLVLRDRP